MTGELPPNYEKPEPSTVVTQYEIDHPKVCNRCGSLVADWSTHADWHVGLAASAAHVSSMLSLLADHTGLMPKADWPPDLVLTVTWSLEQATKEAKP